MADERNPSAGNRRKKPIPAWYYVAGAGALVGLYYLYRRNAAAKLAATTASQSTTAASTGASSATAPVAAGSYGANGDDGALISYLQSMQQAGATAAGTSSATTAYSLPTTQSQIGAGFGESGSSGNTNSVTNAAGQQFTQIPQTDSYQQLLNSGLGQSLYYQVSPGTFTPVTQQVASTGAASGAPLFLGPSWAQASS